MIFFQFNKIHFAGQEFAWDVGQIESTKSNIISGTAAERQADDKVTIASMSRNQLIEEKLKTEGLCHPNLYPDAQEKEKEWIKYLTNLRKELSQKS